MQRHSLVTGGAGFIGSELIRHLLLRGDRVTVLDNLSVGRKAHVPSDCTLIEADLFEAPSALAGQRFDDVYHLAALHYIPDCNAHPALTLDINVEGTVTLLSALRETLPKRIFLASTAAVYPGTSQVHRESDALDPLDVYGVSKMLAELVLEQFCQTTGVPVLIGRLFNVYGPRETNPHLIPRIVEQLRQHPTYLELGNLTPARDYVHVTDVCRDIVTLMSMTWGGLRRLNIASGEEQRVQDVVTVFESVLGHPIACQTLPSLKREQDRLHLRGDTTGLRALLPSWSRKPFKDGISELLSENLTS